MSAPRELREEFLRICEGGDYGKAVEFQSRIGPFIPGKAKGRKFRTVCGLDISYSKGSDLVFAAAALFSYPDMKLIEERNIMGRETFPYIPGLLAFRELPVLLEAFARLTRTPDLILVDGQGLAHPRRFGIACHLGLLLDLPTIGCAKSRLVGTHGMIGEEVGSQVEVVDGGQVVGMAVRTRPGSKPIYVSVGHKVDLAAAVGLVLACIRGYRLPEPTRLAHLAAAGPLEDVDSRFSTDERGQIPNG